MVRERLLKVFRELEIGKSLDENIIINADYVEDKVFDSIAFVTLVVAIENEFGIDIEGESLLIENLSNFLKIEKLIIGLLKEKGVMQ